MAGWLTSCCKHIIAKFELCYHGQWQLMVEDTQQVDSDIQAENVTHG